MKLAVIRIRGIRKVNPKIDKTLGLLRLEKPNHCILLEDTAQNKGMLNVVKDYVAFGPVDEELIFALLRKRGHKGAKLLRSLQKEEEIKSAAKAISGGKKTLDYADPVFRLNPPSSGYKDIRRPYPAGDLGMRDDMPALLRKMM